MGNHPMYSGFLPRARLQTLLDRLTELGYRCVGPQVREAAIVYDTLERIEQLPQGVTDGQQPGEYRLESISGPRNFAWANGPQALKPLLFAPRETLWESHAHGQGGVQFVDRSRDAAEKIAVLGVRACDFAALALQDRHFLDGQEDPWYRRRRENMLLVGVNCTHPAATCFCASTGDGPVLQSGYDIALSELDDGFLAEAGTDAGRSVLDALALEEETEQQREYVGEEQYAAATCQTRELASRNLRDPLFKNLNHKRWDDVAQRCLACGNCVSVCPTCFCHAESDIPSLDGSVSEHVRQWDSCYSAGHSYIHGILVRADIRGRYRQWLTHKLGGWHDQYGRSGCVGCGRCITWCPVGIDITEEANAICGGSSQ